MVVHGEDIRRPLGLTRDHPPAPLSSLLRPYAGTDLVVLAWGRVRGLRLEADDDHLVVGQRTFVRGSTFALIMAMTGRKDCRAELSGPGVPPEPAGIRAIETGSESTWAITVMAFPIPNSSTESGTSTHDHTSPFTTTRIKAVKLTSTGPTTLAIMRFQSCSISAPTTQSRQGHSRRWLLEGSLARGGCCTAR